MSEAGSSPEALVQRYYRALHDGDMKALREMMDPESYRMTLEVYGLKCVFADPAFKTVLERAGSDADARAEAERVVGTHLRAEKPTRQLEVLRTESLGAGRCSVHYMEDGCPKKLTFSETSGAWLIDYFAGRRRD